MENQDYETQIMKQMAKGILETMEDQHEGREGVMEALRDDPHGAIEQAAKEFLDKQARRSEDFEKLGQAAIENAEPFMRLMRYMLNTGARF